MTNNGSNVSGTIVFDLDGTLVDSVPDIAGSLDQLMLEKGLEPIGVPLARKLIGHGVGNLVRSALTVRGIEPGPGNGQEDVDRFVAIYAGRVCQETRPYPHVEKTLIQLASAGWHMAVCTNKAERLAKLVVEDLGLSQYFQVVAGPETFGVIKPDPRHLTETVKAAGRYGPVIFVGDSEVDVQTAKAAEIPVIAMTYGYSKVLLDTLEPDALLDHFSDIPQAIATILARSGAGQGRRKT